MPAEKKRRKIEGCFFEILGELLLNHAPNFQIFNNYNERRVARFAPKYGALEFTHVQ